MPALATETLTNDSNVRIGAIDSMADGEGEVPDPELHEITIADAIAQGARPSCCSGRRPTARASSAGPR